MNIPNASSKKNHYMKFVNEQKDVAERKLRENLERELKVQKDVPFESFRFQHLLSEHWFFKTAVLDPRLKRIIRELKERGYRCSILFYGNGNHVLYVSWA